MALITKFVVLLISAPPDICEGPIPSVVANHNTGEESGMFDTYIQTVEHYKFMKEHWSTCQYRIGTISWNDVPNMENHNA